MGIVNPSVAPHDMLTLADYYQRLDSSGNVLDIAEALNESNEVMQDIVFKEGNLTNGDQQSIRTGLPDVYWKQFNRGTPSSKSSIATVQEQCGQMEAKADIDADLLDMNGQANSAAVRFQEDKAFIEAMGQKATYTIFKGDYKKTSEGFSGFETRYSDLSAVNGKNIIDAGGTGNKLTSIWLVGWGDNVYCPYPKGSKIGLRAEDKGKIFVPDENGNEYEVYRKMYKMNLGLMVKDWRYVVRIANIDPAQLKTNTGIGNPDLKKTGSNLITMMLDALTRLPTDAKANFKFYMNRDVFSGLNALSLRSDTNVIEWHNATNAFGKGGSWADFQGISMRRVDQLTNSEKQVA